MGDTTRRATLIISAKDDASQQIGENSLKFTELNSAVELAKKGVELFKQAYDFAEQGAAIQRIGEQWQATAAQFGINADAAVKAMDKATNGTVDDEELMKVATRALTQETVANAQQLTDFFSIARAMTVRFGGDVVANTEAINMAIETGMSRQLKARGIVVNFTEAYKTYADQLGVTVASLDDETKKMIRRNEVLAEGDKLVKKVGDTGADAATKYEQFNRNLTEVGDTLKVMASDGLTPFISGVNESIKMIDGSATPIEALNYNLKVMKDNYGANSVQAKLAQEAIDLYNREIQIAKDSQDAFNAKVAAGTAYLQSGYIPALDQAADKLETVGGKTRHLIQGEHDLIATLKDQSDAWKSQLSVSENITTENKKFSTTQDDLIQKADDLKAKIDKLAKSNGAVYDTHKAVTLSVDERAATESKLAVVEEDLAQHQKKKSETDLEFKARMDGLAVTADNLRGKLVGVSSIGHVDNSKEIGKLKTDLEGVNADILANRQAHDDATNHIVFDYAMQQMAVDGFSTTEQKALNLLAAQFGFTSDSSEAMTLKVLAATDRLAKDQNIGAFDTAMLMMTGRVNTNLENLMDHLDQTRAKINALPDKDVTINFFVNGASDIPNVGHPTGGGGAPKSAPVAPAPAPHANKGYAEGADFVVPPGYTNDSYPMRVQSGEHVRVTPAGQASSGMTNNITINDPITSAIWYEKIYGEQRAVLDALM